MAVFMSKWMFFPCLLWESISIYFWREERSVSLLFCKDKICFPVVMKNLPFLWAIDNGTKCTQIAFKLLNIPCARYFIHSLFSWWRKYQACSTYRSVFPKYADNSFWHLSRLWLPKYFTSFGCCYCSTHFCSFVWWVVLGCCTYLHGLVPRCIACLLALYICKNSKHSLHTFTNGCTSDWKCQHALFQMVEACSFIYFKCQTQ